MPREHDLKCADAYFDAVASGEKCFEVRRDDRGFQRGDVLVLRRWGKCSCLSSPGYLSPRGRLFTVSREEADTIRAEITYVLTGGQLGIEPGYVVMGLRLMEAEHDQG